MQRVENTRAATTVRSTAGAHGTRPATWADALRTPPAAPTRTAPPVKHCWYCGAHGRQATLLLEWRQRDGYYRGRIAVAAALEPDGWAVIELWVDQGMAAPV